MFCIKSKEILSKTSFQEATSAPQASNQGVQNGHISFDLLQNMTFHEKTKVFKIETVKKNVGFNNKNVTTTINQNCRVQLFLRKSYVFDFDMLKC